ncbi:alkaline phosphatase-like isoform X3 [Amblyomma americanum]
MDIRMCSAFAWLVTLAAAAVFPVPESHREGSSASRSGSTSSVMLQLFFFKWQCLHCIYLDPFGMRINHSHHHVTFQRTRKINTDSRPRLLRFRPRNGFSADREFWFDQGAQSIEQRLRQRPNTRRARQVVFFLGDGMGVSTLTAARIYKGQRLQRNSGEEGALAWDSFPHVSLSRTYGLDVQTSDSANTATAYLSGVKANYETLGVDSRVKVILGGGRRVFLDKSMKDDEGQPGERSDGRNLINDWLDEKKSHSPHVKYIWNRRQLHAVNPNTTEYLLGLFDSDHLPYSYERRSLKTTKPSLPEMARVALDVLQRAPHGFLLLVEGGRIDHAHHTTRAGLALEEMLELDRAVDDALERFSSSAETLLLVTADHSHTLSLGGLNTPRGRNVLGLAGFSDVDQQPYTVLAYGNGPTTSQERANLSEKETTSMNYTQQAAFLKRLETHSGEDVAVFAAGAWAHLFSGVHDQTYIPHALAYAACIGQFSGAECHSEQMKGH